MFFAMYIVEITFTFLYVLVLMPFKKQNVGEVQNFILKKNNFALQVF